MRKFHVSIVTAIFVFSLSPIALPKALGATIVKSRPDAPIKLTLVGNSGGTRGPGAKGGLSFFIAGGTLPAEESIQFDLTRQRASLKLICHNKDPRSEPTFEIVAADGGNRKKVPTTTIRSRDTRLTIVAQGAGNRGHSVTRMNRGSAPITLGII